VPRDRIAKADLKIERLKDKLSKILISPMKMY
jgi:hypothetical protein